MQKILYFLSLVKADASVDAVCNIHPSQAFLKAPALCIGSIKYGKVIIMVMVS